MTVVIRSSAAWLNFRTVCLEERDVEKNWMLVINGVAVNISVFLYPKL